VLKQKFGEGQSLLEWKSEQLTNLNPGCQRHF
jgi:hypothetical protein